MEVRSISAIEKGHKLFESLTEVMAYARSRWIIKVIRQFTDTLKVI